MNYRDYKDARANYNKAKLVVAKARRGGEAVKDIAESVKGVKENKRRKRFWEKKPFQNAVAAAAIMAGTGAALKYGPKLANKVLLANRARNIYLRKLGYEVNLDDFNADIEFDDLDTARDKGWEVRNPTSSSIKLQRRGRNKRERRKKTTTETVGFKNKLIAGLGAGLVGTTGLSAYLALLGRKRGALLKAKGVKTNLSPKANKQEKELLKEAKRDKDSAKNLRIAK